MDADCHSCLVDNMIIPTTSVCDGVIDCSDLSDECLCDHAIPVCDEIKSFQNRRYATGTVLPRI